jgi:hypothetical protein
MEEELKKELEKRMKKHLFSKGFFILVLIIGLAFSLVSMPSVINQAWAWQVANSMITINGLLIGFSILAVTVFLGKGYSEDLFKKLVEESMDDMIIDFERLKN